MGSCLSSKSARKVRPDHPQPLLGVRHLACASQPDSRNQSPAIGPSPSPPSPTHFARPWPPAPHRDSWMPYQLLCNIIISRRLSATHRGHLGVGCTVHTTGYPCLTSVCRCRAASCHSITAPGYAVRQLLRPSCRLPRPVSANLQCASRR